MASARCVLLLSCWSGVNINGTNLVDYIYEKGAHFVIGSQKKLQDSVADVWQNTFMGSIKKGATIAESVRSAEEDAEEFAIELSNLIGEPIDTDSVMRSVGDASQRLN